MKAIKIEINKQNIDIPEGKSFYEEYSLPSPATLLKEGGPTQEGYQMERTVYEIREICWSGEVIGRFLVKINDHHMFDTLVKISDDDINRKIDEKITLVEKRFELEKEKIILEQAIEKDKVIKEIRNLPWWKRLFNKF